MKNEYKKRIERVVEYIEDNLRERISLADVAKVSHFSVYHFHRIFTGIKGETVNNYIARRRLEKAVNMLIFKSEISITQIALDSGFSSSANFAKAVKQHFGYTPSEIRNPEKIKDSKIGKLFSKYGKAFEPSDLYPTRVKDDVINKQSVEDIKMKVEIRELDAMSLCTLASENGYQMESIYDTWDKLISWGRNAGIKEDAQQKFALAYDNPTVTPIEKCRYTASIVVDNDITINEPFKRNEIPSGKYAVVSFKGQPEETLDTQLSLYSEWLPESGFEPDNFPMMEKYLNDARIDGHLEMEIYVKLKDL
ncbi:AraC family transcriptional regulator [Kangiella sediminilitoris]|uniref:AraC family transcriptional regulator n=1 Tax=Kangiella sediminilitoris TaxID=1144748 RepID=A0A1B3B7M0_9GAMM|nr:GyrI-like domain-containing protein [Kangiella sediminilitoris]AOE48791.1 AraC family transcriptional regulator [Kangiella sediminilitoris]